MTTFQPKPAAAFAARGGIRERALDGGAKLFIHCAAGVHRAPMMALAVLDRLGGTEEAMQLIEDEASGGGFCRRVCAERGGFLVGIEPAEDHEGDIKH